MHLSDFLWFLICVALLLATLKEDVRDHAHLLQWPYLAEIVDQPSSTALTGTAAYEIPWDGLIAGSDSRYE